MLRSIPIQVAMKPNSRAEPHDLANHGTSSRR
jgi:hypothetical protein